ncbi:MAG: Wzz/FepE/Etk N-terminal domain-containing protein [Bacteroidia bacterium]
MSENNSVGLDDLVYYVRFLLNFLTQNIKMVVLFALIGGALGFTYATIKKPIYKSYLSFLVNENEGSQLNISSLAGLAGIGNIGGGAINEDKLMFLSTSRYIVGSTLLSNIYHNGKEQMIANVFIDVYKLQNGLANDTTLIGFEYFKNTNIDHLTFQENKVLDLIIKIIKESGMLKVEAKKKTGIVAQNAGIVTIDFFSKNEDLSKCFVENMYDILSKYYVQKVTQRQLKNFNLIKNRADSLKLLITGKEVSGAELIDQNMNMARMAARLNIERTRRDVELLNLMYAEVLKNLEVAKFTLENQTPMLQVVDAPTYPLRMEKASNIIFAFLGSFVSGFLGFSFLLAKNYLKGTSTT